MKLEDYKIREAMQSNNWDTAIECMCNFFKIKLYKNPVIEIIADPECFSEIIIVNNDRTYSWCEEYSFSIWPTNDPSSWHNLVAGSQDLITIYANQVLPAK